MDGDTKRLLEIMYPQLLYFFVDSKEESKVAKAAGPVRSFKPPCYSRVDSHVCGLPVLRVLVCVLCVLCVGSSSQPVSKVLADSERRVEIQKADRALLSDAGLPRCRKSTGVANSRATVKKGGLPGGLASPPPPPLPHLPPLFESFPHSPR
jgi:hypothetical protein